MNESLTYQGIGTVPRDRTHTLFAQTMGYVAVTAALFALGAYLGRDLTGGAGIAAFIGALRVQRMVQVSPPSTTISAPVTYRASSLAR